MTQLTQSDYKAYRLKIMRDTSLTAEERQQLLIKARGGFTQTDEYQQLVNVMGSEYADKIFKERRTAEADRLAEVKIKEVELEMELTKKEINALQKAKKVYEDLGVRLPTQPDTTTQPNSLEAASKAYGERMGE